MPANPNAVHISEGNHFFWASAMSAGTCREAGVFILSLAAAKASAAPLPPGARCRRQQSRAPRPPSPLCKARRQRRDIETSRTSVCPCAGEGTGVQGTPPRQRRAPRTGRRRLASRKRVKCWLRMLLLFKELGRRVTSATTASSATSQDKAPENFIKKPRFGNSRQVRPTGRLLPQTGAAADVSEAPVVPGPGSTP